MVVWKIVFYTLGQVRSTWQRIITLVVVAMLISSGLAGVAAADTETDVADASVTFTQQTAGGYTVVVDSVTLTEGGFVTIHDATLGDGAQGH